MRRIGTVALVVPDYESGIAFYVGTLAFTLIEDRREGRKRFVRVAPSANGPALLLARAETDAQKDAVGNQTGGRVAFFLETDDFARDHGAMRAAGVAFEEAPRREPYGTVAVWRDPFDNRWDLIEPAPLSSERDPARS